MNLINVWVFYFLKFSTISFSCKSLCLQITAYVSKISKKVQGDFAFNLNVLLETVNVFA